ncbi:hypothetical protein ROZALSC1DRAFT_26378, partial [Rozella allomycis CSF55]
SREVLDVDLRSGEGWRPNDRNEMKRIILKENILRTENANIKNVIMDEEGGGLNEHFNRVIERDQGGVNDEMELKSADGEGKGGVAEKTKLALDKMILEDDEGGVKEAGNVVARLKFDLDKVLLDGDKGG